jgi:diguanylate cyclase (GGDEF)-like protein/PAS domain S-box-containing protein
VKYGVVKLDKTLLKFAKPPVKISSIDSASSAYKPWEILVVDDDQSIHDVTRLILRDFEFEGRPVNITHGYSAKEAMAILQENNNFAVLLLDVVMETDHAGLDLVGYIRNDLKNQFLRIVLRTGQPGQAPELSVIVDYDINDYKEKSELTSHKMRSCLTAALRSYRDIETIQQLATLRQNLQTQITQRNEELEKANHQLKEEIQERTNIQHKLLDTNTQLDSIINNSQAIITMKSLDGKYELVNNLFVKSLELSDVNVIGKTDRELFNEKVAEMIEYSDHEVIAKGEALQYEEILPNIDGEHWYLSVKFPLFDNHKNIYAICCISTDISDRIDAQNEILHMAQYDPLTNLPNRSLFIDRTSQAISRINWDHSIIAILFIDLDRFKLVNDTMGHEVGDELLVEVASRLQSNIRDGDSASRFGGDEFAVLLKDVASETDIIKVTEKLRMQLAKPYNIGGKELVVTPSIGVSRCPIDGIHARTLLKKADVAMYKAKKTTKNSYCFYTHEDDSRASELLSLEIDLRNALKNSQFFLVYQPKVNMLDGKVSGFEALLRWQHPIKGVISPGQFIPILEETGMITEIGHWVTEQACRFAADLVKDGTPFKVAVNLSSKQFIQVGLVDKLRIILKETGCPPELLEIELTEGALMDDVERARTILNEISEMGISLAIDDFGTGYSSMCYLKRFPFSTLKIDRSFIVDAPSFSQDKAIVTTIIQLAHNLGMNIVAEGVETKQQYDLLKSVVSSIDESQIQGFIFSKPLLPSNIVRRKDVYVDMWRNINSDIQ